jgi:hypothetical protein
MAKRTRGSHRPGRRHRDNRGPGRFQPRPAPRPSQGLSAEEEARAAELEAQIVARERSAEAGRASERDRDRGDYDRYDRTERSRGQGILAARAAEEYAYVARDVRRIIRVASLMAAALAVAWLLIDVLRVVKVG